MNEGNSDSLLKERRSILSRLRRGHVFEQTSAHAGLSASDRESLVQTSYNCDPLHAPVGDCFLPLLVLVCRGAIPVKNQ